MTEKELKKLSRAELLELLISQVKENQKLRAKVDELTRTLESRDVALDESGSMASAALRLNGVFEAADAAVRQYISDMEARAAQSRKLEKTTKERCDQMIQQTKEFCQAEREKATREYLAAGRTRAKIDEAMEKRPL